MNSRGLLIVFSGLDGAGKSTQIELLVSRLRNDEIPTRVIWTRGGYTPLFEALKRLLRRLSGRRIVPASGPSREREQALAKPHIRRLWLLLALFDLLWVYGIQIRWLRWRDHTVICDRYLWDTLIDFRLNFPQEQVERWGLWRLLVKASPEPDVAFLFLIPVAESVKRSLQKHEPFPDSPEILSRRLSQYQALAENGYWHVMDGSRPIPELEAEIWAVVEERIHRRAR